MIFHSLSVPYKALKVYFIIRIKADL